MKKFILFSSLLILNSCGPSSGVNVQMQIPQTLPQHNALMEQESLSGWINNLTAPATVDLMDCYFANVYGPNISNANGGAAGGAGCSYTGVTSNLTVPPVLGLSLTVPTGPSRTFQMIGVQTGKGCAGLNTLNDLYAAYPTPTPSSTSSPGYQLYTLGSTTADIYKSTAVSISNSYSATTGAVNPFQCGAAVAPAAVTLSLVAGTGGSDNTNAVLIPDPLPTPLFNTPVLIAPSVLNSLSSTSNASTYTGLSLGSSGKMGRVDLVFSLAGINLASYTSMEVKASFGGENQISPAVSPGATIFFWNNSTTSFSGSIINTSTTPVAMDQTISGISINQSATPGTVVNTTFANASLTPGISSTDNYFYVTVATNAVGGSGSNAAVVNYLQIILKP